MDAIITVYEVAFTSGWLSFLIGITLAIVIAICMDHTDLTNKQQLFWGTVLWLLSPLLILLIKILL